MQLVILIHTSYKELASCVYTVSDVQYNSLESSSVTAETALPVTEGIAQPIRG